MLPLCPSQCWEHAGPPAELRDPACAGVCLAIDDCYEVWESGVLSVPYDFEVKELQPQLRRLLAASSSVGVVTTTTSSSTMASLAVRQQPGMHGPWLSIQGVRRQAPSQQHLHGVRQRQGRCRPVPTMAGIGARIHWR